MPWPRHEPAVRAERRIDPEVAKHEALHLGNALALGLRVLEARADNPEPDQAGRVRFLTADTRQLALVTLAGEFGSPGWPPEWPSKTGDTPDERELAGYVDELRLDEESYRELCAEARRIAEDSRFADVVSVAEELMGRGVVLNESSIKMLCDSLLPADMATKAAGSVRHKSFGLTKAATSDAGWFTATVAVFNNVDKGGDRILPGAFKKTLEKWRRSGDPIPVIWSHEWTSPDAHIGVADPHDVVETEKGLLVRGKLDIDDNDIARRAYKLMQRRSLKEFSFGYSVPPGGQRRANDGANEIIEIDPLVEVGPTLKGMNPATELHGVKSDTGPDLAALPEQTRSPEYATLKEQARREIHALLTAPPEDAPAPRRQRSLVDRELRRQCDRIRLEAALGFDSELIDKLTNRRAA
jgi:HK97 family phage prohead protease